MSPMAVALTPEADSSSGLPIRNTFIHFGDASSCSRSLRLTASDPAPPVCAFEARQHARDVPMDFLPESTEDDDCGTLSPMMTATPEHSPRSTCCSDMCSMPATPEVTPRAVPLCLSMAIAPQSFTPPSKRQRWDVETEWTPERVSRASPCPTPVAARKDLVVFDGGGVVFNFTLRLADNVGLGMQVAPSCDGDGDGKGIMEVREVLAGGAVEAWNRQCAEDVFGARFMKAVFPGDRVVRINGVGDYDGMRRECASRQLLKVSVVRGTVDYNAVLSWTSGTSELSRGALPKGVQQNLLSRCGSGRDVV